MDDLSVIPETWTVAGRTFTSRLIVGTGKYKDYAQNAVVFFRKAKYNSYRIGTVCKIGPHDG